MLIEKKNEIISIDFQKFTRLYYEDCDSPGYPNILNYKQ